MKNSNAANQIPDIWNIEEQGWNSDTVTNEVLDPKSFIANKYCKSE